MSFPGVLQRSIPVREAVVNCSEWSPSGKLLAIGLQSGTVDIVEASGRRLQSLPLRDAVQAISWAPNEELIALATAGDRILIANIRQHNDIKEIKAHAGGVWCVAFSPNGNEIASGGQDGKVTLVSVADGAVRHLSSQRDEVLTVAWAGPSHLWSGAKDGTCEHHQTYQASRFARVTAQVEHLFGSVTEHKFADAILSIAIDSKKTRVAVGCKNGSIFVFDNTFKQIQELEGHTDWVWSVHFTAQDQLLVSDSQDRTVKIWNASTGLILQTLQVSKETFGNIAVQSERPLLAIPNDVRRVLEIWEIDAADAIASAAPEIVTYCSAKVALVGESNVGKSCLALRMAEDRYEELGTTHGMRFWPMAPERLDGAASAPKGQKREVVLWDMGGQDEYRLIHQLFLHDTTVALVLLDPTRGRTAFDEAEGWAKRLEKQLANKQSAKLLVGSKLDSPTGLVDGPLLDRTLKEQQFKGYYATSAKNGRGIKELGKAISDALDWSSLAKTTRPRLFQTVRDEIARARSREEVVLLRKDLESRVRRIEGSDFESSAVAIVVSQLALQGMIAVTRLSSSEQALVLQVEHVERYAGSILMAAKNNPRGVPAIQETVLLSAEMEFPGMPAERRLSAPQERIVLECLVQLLIEHGICIEHAGLLIFPSLFPSTAEDNKDDIGQSVSLYYDFSGAIDNIYSSLVSALSISEQFGAVRLWDNRAEFIKSGQGRCGLRKTTRQRGFAHLDVYVSDDTSDTERDLFISVVEEHLTRYGVDIYEHVEVTCVCSHRFDEETVRQRIADGHSEIGCPLCDRRVRISEGAKEVRQKDPDVQKHTWALRSAIQKRKNDVVARAKRNLSRVEGISFDKPIRILHLSDLHVSVASRWEEMLGPLCSDLRNKRGGLGFENLDYLVISGDITNRGQEAEFEIARAFVSGLISEFGLNAERCVIVPGNHDVNWDVDVYEWVSKRKVSVAALPAGTYLEQGTGLLVRGKAYNDRIKSFSDYFYHTLVQKAYPLDPEKQALNFYFPNDGLQFISLNSCWELDEHFPERSSINKVAVAEGLRVADKASGLRERTGSLLRIGVWHHPITGNEKIEDDAFLTLLQQAGLRMALHGHVHEDRADLVGYLMPETSIHVIGAGSFGAGPKARPESTPRLYNVVEIDRNLRSARIYTRCLRKDGGAWEGWALWPGATVGERRSYYNIALV